MGGRKDDVDGILMSGAGMAEDHDHTRLGRALCELMRRAWTQGRRAQAHSMPGVKLWSAKEAEKGWQGRKVVRNNMRCGSMLSFESQKGTGEKRRWGRGVGKRRESQTAQVEDDGSTKARCRQPYAAFRFAGRGESSSHSDRPGGTGARETDRSAKGRIAMTEVRSPTT